MNSAKSIVQWTCALTLAAALPFFFIGDTDWQTTPLTRQLWNAGHIAFFSLAIIWLGNFVNFATPIRCFYATLSTLIVGATIEIIQRHIGREFSYQDIYLDIAGLWLGLAWLQKSSKRIWLLRLCALLLLTPFLWLVIQASQLQFNSVRNFPLLAGFEYDAELLRISGPVSISTQYKSEGQRSLKVTFNTDRYSTVSIDPPLGNWEGYKIFGLDIFNPEATPLRIVLRIADKAHDQGNQVLTDRYNTALVLTPGWNTIELQLDDIRQAPIYRSLNVNMITNIALFSANLNAPRSVFIDNIRLE